MWINICVGGRLTLTFFFQHIIIYSFIYLFFLSWYSKHTYHTRFAWKANWMTGCLTLYNIIYLCNYANFTHCFRLNAMGRVERASHRIALLNGWLLPCDTQHIKRGSQLWSNFDQIFREKKRRHTRMSTFAKRDDPNYTMLYIQYPSLCDFKRGGWRFISVPNTPVAPAMHRTTKQRKHWRFDGNGRIGFFFCRTDKRAWAHEPWYACRPPLPGASGLSSLF